MVTRPKVQEQCIYKRKKEKKIHKIVITSPKISTLPLTKVSYTNSPPKNDYSYIPKLLPLFVTSDNG